MQLTDTELIATKLLGRAPLVSSPSPTSAKVGPMLPAPLVFPAYCSTIYAAAPSATWNAPESSDPWRWRYQATAQRASTADTT